MSDISDLTAPLALPTERLPNRLAKAAMTEGLADAHGRPSPDRETRAVYQDWTRAARSRGAGFWFYQQIRRLAAGRPADLNLRVLATLKRESADQGARLAGKAI